MDKQRIQQLVEEAMQSMDAAHKAAPAPYLLTRINARRQNGVQPTNVWEKALLFITRPSVAFPALALVFALNFWLFQKSNDEGDALATEVKMVTNDDYSLSTATSLFDFENLP